MSPAYRVGGWSRQVFAKCCFQIKFIGINLSRAFDTIRRNKQLYLLSTFIDESERQMILFLPADTSLELRLSTGECQAFVTTIGKPQGDTLSGVAHSLSGCDTSRPTIAPSKRPLLDSSLPFDVEYADDTDFISSSCSFLDEIERITSASSAEWSLTYRTESMRNGRRLGTKAELGYLDVYHRHPRSSALYRRCRCCPISEAVSTARCRLFGTWSVLIDNYD